MEAFVIYHKGKLFTTQFYSRPSSAKGRITTELKYHDFKREDFEIVRLIPEKDIKHYLVSTKNLDDKRTLKSGIFFNYEEAQIHCDQLFDEMTKFKKYFSIFIDTWQKEKLLKEEVVYEKLP